MNGPISGPDGQQASASVHFPADLVLANSALCLYRHIEIDVSVAGMQVDVRREIARYFQGHAAVTCL